MHRAAVEYQKRMRLQRLQTHALYSILYSCYPMKRWDHAALNNQMFAFLFCHVYSLEAIRLNNPNRLKFVVRAMWPSSTPHSPRPVPWWSTDLWTWDFGPWYYGLATAPTFRCTWRDIMSNEHIHFLKPLPVLMSSELSFSSVISCVFRHFGRLPRSMSQLTLSSVVHASEDGRGKITSLLVCHRLALELGGRARQLWHWQAGELSRLACQLEVLELEPVRAQWSHRLAVHFCEPFSREDIVGSLERFSNIHEDSNGSSWVNVCWDLIGRNKLGHPILKPWCKLVHCGGHLDKQCVELLHEIEPCCILIGKDLLPTREQNGVRWRAAWNSCFTAKPVWKMTE